MANFSRSTVLFSIACAVISYIGVVSATIEEFQAPPCECKDTTHCNYVSSWDTATKEIIVTTNETRKYEDWMWATITTVLALSENGNQDLMCYTHSQGKKYGVMQTVPGDKNMSKIELFTKLAATYAEGERADVIALDFMKLLGNCENAAHHVDHIINITQTVIHGVKSRNVNLRVLCVLPWQPPCYGTNCGIAPVMATLCDGVILNVNSFDTYCDEACVAKALVPYTKIMISIQEYTAMGFNTSQLLLSVPWHGFNYTCDRTDVIDLQKQKFVCHLKKKKVEGKPDMCLYEESRERVDLPTMFAEHPHLQYDMTTYSRPDQAIFHHTQEGNGSYLLWMEDVGSLTAKYQVVNDYNLKGVVIYTAEDLTYGSLKVKDRYNTNMWNWVLHSILLTASSGTKQENPQSYAGTIAGIGVGMFLFGCLMGSLIACVIFRRKRMLRAPFHTDKTAEEFHDEEL